MTPTDGLTDEFLGKLHMAYSIGWSKPVNAHPSTYPYHERLNAYEAMRALLSPLLVAAEARGRREADKLVAIADERRARAVAGWQDASEYIAKLEHAAADKLDRCSAENRMGGRCQMMAGHIGRHRGQFDTSTYKWPNAQPSPAPAPPPAPYDHGSTSNVMLPESPAPSESRLREALEAVVAKMRIRGTLWSGLPMTGFHLEHPTVTFTRLADQIEAALRPASPVPAPVERPDEWKVPFRRMMDIACMCGDEFDSIEAFIEHGRMVHDDKDEAPPAEPAPQTHEEPRR